MAGAREEDGACRGFRALDTLRVIVRHLGSQAGHAARLLRRIEQPAGGGYAHGRAVAAAAVGLWILCPQPV